MSWNQDNKNKLEYYEIHPAEFFGTLDLYKIQRLCTARMKVLKQIQNLPHPIQDQGKDRTWAEPSSITKEHDIIYSNPESAISYWLCRFAFACPEASDKLEWYRDQELRLYAYIHKDDSSNQYGNEIKEDLYQYFDSEDVERYKQQKFTKCIPNQKYVLGLLQSHFKNPMYAIKNGKMLLNNDLYKDVFQNNQQVFKFIDFLDYFNKTQEYAQQFSQLNTNKDIKDLLTQIQNMQFEDCVVNEDQIAQQHKTEIKSSAVPLCMSRVLFQLKNKHHLKHLERMQLYPWLLDIGISSQDAIEFVKKYFCQDPQMSNDKFKKQYQYNIEHIYGQQGKKQKSHCLGCNSIIKTIPGPGQSYGCPYRTLSRPDLEDLLARNGLYDNTAKGEIFNSISKQNFTMACEKTFFYKFQDGMGGCNPVRYLNEAAYRLKQMKQQNDEADQILKDENENNNQQQNSPQH